MMKKYPTIKKYIILFFLLIVSIGILRGEDGPLYRTTLMRNNVVIVNVGKYHITYQMHLMPHVKITHALIKRSLLAPANVKAEYKFEGTVRKNGKIVATLFRVSAKKFVHLASTMSVDGDPVISFRSHSAWTRYKAEKGIKIEEREAYDFYDGRLTVQDTVYTVHTEKSERINMRVEGRRSTYLTVPLETVPYTALHTVYGYPRPKNLSGAWVEQKEQL